VRAIIVVYVTVIGEIHPDAEPAVPVQNIIMDGYVITFIKGDPVVLLGHGIAIELRAGTLVHQDTSTQGLGMIGPDEYPAHGILLVVREVIIMDVEIRGLPCGYGIEIIADRLKVLDGDVPGILYVDHVSLKSGSGYPDTVPVDGDIFLVNDPDDTILAHIGKRIGAAFYPDT
jgi:hypothetical protein